MSKRGPAARPEPSTDTAQSLGKIQVDADALDVHLLTVVGHKMYAPKGVAALWGPGGIALRPVIGVGGQEADPRAGTENVPPSSHSATQSISPVKPWPTGRPSG